MKVLPMKVLSFHIHKHTSKRTCIKKWNRPARRSWRLSVFYVASVMAVIIIILFIVAEKQMCDIYLYQDSVFPPQNITVVSDCKITSIAIDNKTVQFEQVFNGSQYIVNLNLNMSEGEHYVLVSSDDHRASYIIISKIKECEPGSTRDCLTEAGCDGKQTCTDYRWSSCRQNKRICRPGYRKPCAYTPCIVGHKVCNECGTGYGPCLPG